MAHALADQRLRRRLIVGLTAVLLLGVAVLVRAITSSGQTHVTARAPAARANEEHASVGPGPVRKIELVNGYRVAVRYTPNRASTIGVVSVELLKDGRPVNAARVRLTTTMLTMKMGYTGLLSQKGPGRYSHAWPPLLMRGRWRLEYEISPRVGRRFAVTLVDQVS